ncbi:MAG TPA: ferritin-like domain-containing protein [Actinomycetota bacterium]|nr:ferritin-like domain-containing protein [Actinomycetota bacterium]
MAQEKSPFGGQPVIRFATEVDRRSFMKWAGLVGAGTSLAVAGVACSDAKKPRAARDESPAPTQDVEILNFALTLELLEADFYDRGLKANLLTGRDLELVTPIKAHEDAHVSAITATVQKLGGTPAARPTFVYPDATFKDRATFLATAARFENLGVTAYHGQVTRIGSKEVLAAAASIAGVESRHAAILADLTGGKPFPAPVEAKLDKEAVLQEVKPFIGASSTASPAGGTPGGEEGN